MWLKSIIKLLNSLKVEFKKHLNSIDLEECQYFTKLLPNIQTHLTTRLLLRYCVAIIALKLVSSVTLNPRWLYRYFLRSGVSNRIRIITCKLFETSEKYSFFVCLPHVHGHTQNRFSVESIFLLFRHIPLNQCACIIDTNKSYATMCFINYAFQFFYK